ncbi:MAG: hypothetical protein AAB586_00825 [Patescibacteria group bacterium]
MKKIFIITIVALVIILIGSLGWYLFARNPEISTSENVGNILPFGSGDNGNISVTITDNEFGRDNAVDSSGGGSSFDEFGSPTANLFRISNVPIAGMVIFKKSGATIVRYVDRATGHIYDIDLMTFTKTRIVNQTLPKIYEAYFKSDGNTVLMRSLRNDSDVVDNLILNLTPPQSTSTNTLYAVSSTPLRGNINAIAVGSGNTLIYSRQDTLSIVSSTFNGTGAKTLLNSVFTNWRLATAGNNLIIYTGASADVPGLAYDLNTSNGVLTKILGPLNGLVAIPETSGKRVLYSYSENNKTRLFAKNLTDNTQSEILPTTLAEKCIWSIKQIGVVYCGSPTNEPGPSEPDGWYQGLTHFSDRIWSFNTNNEVAQVLMEPKIKLDVDIDLTEPRLSPDEDYLVFINKTDLSLWALKLD